MKKRILFVFLLSAISLVTIGCNPIDTNENVSSTDVGSKTMSEISDSELSEISEIKDESSASEEKFEAWWNGNEEHIGEIHGCDFQTAYDMCSKALTELPKAYKNGEDMDFSKYIEDENLIKYMEKRLKSTHRYNEMNLVTGTNSAGYSYNDEMMYLRIQREMSGGYATTEFVVKNSNGRLVIAEWYDDDKDCFDYSARGRLDIKSAAEDQKTYWDNFDSEALWKKIDSLD